MNESDVYAGDGVLARALKLAAEKEAANRERRLAEQEAVERHEASRAKTMEVKMWTLLGELGEALRPHATQVRYGNDTTLVAEFKLPGGLELRAYFYDQARPYVQFDGAPAIVSVTIRDELTQDDLMRFGFALVDWLKAAERVRAQREGREQWRRAEVEYRKAAAEWEERRDELVDGLQETMDAAGEFYTFLLKYGVVAIGEGELYADTYTVRVLDDEPDGDGWWNVVHPSGDVEAMRIYHPVSLGEPEERVPSRPGYARQVYHGGLYLWVAPRTIEERVAWVQGQLAEIAEEIGPAPKPEDFGLEDYIDF